MLKLFSSTFRNAFDPSQPLQSTVHSSHDMRCVWPYLSPQLLRHGTMAYGESRFSVVVRIVLLRGDTSVRIPFGRHLQLLSPSDEGAPTLS